MNEKRGMKTCKHALLLPNHQRWQLSWNMYTLHARSFARLAPIHVLSRCLLTKFLLSRKLRVRLLVGYNVVVKKRSLKERREKKSPPFLPPPVSFHSLSTCSHLISGRNLLRGGMRLPGWKEGRKEPIFFCCAPTP